MDIVQIYPEGGIKIKSRERGWRWRLLSANGQVTSASGQAFASKWNAKRAAVRLFPGASIVEVDK